MPDNKNPNAVALVVSALLKIFLANVNVQEKQIIPPNNPNCII